MNKNTPTGIAIQELATGESTDDETGFTHISNILPRVLELIKHKAILESFSGDPYPWHAELSRQLDHAIDGLDRLSESECVEPWR